ncbi:MAG: putative peptidoglycan lipid flippase [Blastocatellia bacterium]|nr:putative peptidoglycan lipid flippase [Blastocatellia bacterium]MDX6306000.1 putative peptidoglycan lipid flippase [Blastocatellia bacterium]
MNNEQDSGPKAPVPGSKPKGGGPDATPPNKPNSEGLDSRSSPSEIAGETTDVVGEATGAFPRPTTVDRSERESTAKSAFMVGAGILLSRIIGVVRQRVFAHYLGISDAAGAFNAAFRIPNFLQNVFGEGALSASFIPVYARLLAQGDKKEASRVADAVLTLLALATSVIVLLGVLTTPFFVGLFAYSFDESTRALTIQLVRILFPGAGLLVLSAWCLGVLNSHRRFFLSYTAPVVWNLALIGTLIWFGRSEDQFHLATMAAWGSVLGSALQFAVQMPTVLKLIRRLRPVLDIASENVRTVLRNFFPVFMSRGVVQISAFVDAMLAGLISAQAVAALAYAQSLYTLPVSLFGMSISAAELPAMSSALGTTSEVAGELRVRLDRGLRRIAFFIVPSVMAMMAFGDVMTGALYQSGRFHAGDSTYVWGILAGSTIGLLASTLGRLYASTYYALHDTRTPLVYAVIRVTLTTVLGYLFAIPLPPAIGLDPKWGVAGLTASAGIAGWIEFALLRRNLNKRIGKTGLPLGYVAKLWLAAAVGAGVGWAIKLGIGAHHPAIIATLVLLPFGLVYFGVTAALKVPELNAVFGRVLKLANRGR